MFRGGNIVFSLPKDWLIVGCLVCIGILSFNAPKVCDFFLALLAGSGAYFWFRYVRIITLPLVFSIVWIVFLVCIAASATITGIPGKHFAQLGKHLPIALGPIIAIAFAEVARRRGLSLIFNVFLSALIAGSCVVLIWNGGLEVVALVFHGHFLNAPDLGRINRNFAALSAGIGLISAIALIGNQWTLQNKERIHKAAICFTLLLVAFFAVIVVALQSRGAYAATSAALFIQLTTFVWRASGAKTALATLISGLIVASVSFAAAADLGAFSGSRLVAKGGLVNNLVAVKDIVSGVPLLNRSSKEDRLELLAIGVDLIRQRPWLGWGTDIAQVIQEHSPDSPVARLRQLHNGYLQTIVHFGVLGTILLSGLLWSIVRSSVRSAGARLSPTQLSVCLAFVAYLSVFNLSETILFVSPAASIAIFLAVVACIGETQARIAG